ncbi:MAG: ChaN family lipoprotein [Vicinamibacterales bacterium]
MRITAATLALTAALGGVALAQDRSPNLSIGDPARRDRQVSVVLDGITDTTAGDVLTPDELAARLDGVRLLFVGESHTSQAFHDVQLRVLQALRARGRRVIVGLEMYPYTEQRWLDEWSAGSMTESDFVTKSRWYRNWGYNWNYYREIFQFARAQSIRLYGVNVPRTVVQTARTKGLDALDAEARGYLPPRIDLDSAEHRTLFRAYFGDGDPLHSLSSEQWEGMYRAQSTWDAAMGYGAVKALEDTPDPNAIAVVLIGAGHVAYGLGAERQAALWFKGRQASLIPVPVTDESGKPTDPVRASYANFVWGVMAESAPAYPVLGLSTSSQKEGDAYKVIGVSKGSLAESSGFKVGDFLVSLDDAAIDDVETLNRLMAQKRWGDAAAFRIRRGSEVVPIRVLLRRSLPKQETR